MLYRQVHGLPLLPPFLSYPLVINLYAPVMKTPQLSFSRIVRESGTTLVVTMGLYLVPGCTVALLSTANYRQVMGPQRLALCGTTLAHGTTMHEGKEELPIYSQLSGENELPERSNNC